MPGVHPNHARRTITLPKELIAQVEQQQGAGETFSDVVRRRLETHQSGVDARLSAIERELVRLHEMVSTELSALQFRLGEVVEVLEGMTQTREKPPATESEVKIASYEEMYGADEPPQAAPSPAPQERKRWWTR
jgi:hypothetical protein